MAQRTGLVSSEVALRQDYSGGFYSSELGLGGERLKPIIENYLKYYAAGAGHTARAKRYDLQHFLEFLALHKSQGQAVTTNASELESVLVDVVLVSDWTLQSTKDFIEHRLTLGEAPATVGRRLATIKHFGRTLAERVHGYINPAREAKPPVVQVLNPKSLTAEEIALLRQAAVLMRNEEENSFLAERNVFLLELLLATGLRADEVRILSMSQISDDLSWLRNVKTKGKKFRVVYLDTDIRLVLKNYLIKREAAILENFPAYTTIAPADRLRLPVFVGFYRASFLRPSSFGLSSKTIWRIIANFGNRAQQLAEKKITNLHPHKLRHTFAHGLLDSSNDVRLVAQALGHSDVRTTMRYTERTEEEIAKAIEKKLKAG